jgi:hypothetical protein
MNELVWRWYPAVFEVLSITALYLRIIAGAETGARNARP